MEKFLGKLFDMMEQGKYKDIINILTWLFMLISPSYLYFFIYRTDLFKSIDTLKLLILCVIINSFCLFITLIIIYTIKEYMRFKCTNNNLDKEILKDSIIMLKALIIIIIPLIFLFKLFY